ncbi:hypothetical protein [Erythrobacter sp. WG]|uniref:hypothetical protein n=1 Tax=Erythrobacter sp. WG TaxID=2985510 RepID=UPI00226EFE6C|nr:hypothetical protein [Erythrobacter sp. WG]MCX9148299.1 hypothetical protein [Erythrobacter sp. WG]
MTTLLIDPILVLTAGSLIGLALVAAALLRAWAGWLELKRQELDRAAVRAPQDEGSGLGTARIELADLKERIRKLEAIASGVEL